MLLIASVRYPFLPWKRAVSVSRKYVPTYDIDKIMGHDRDQWHNQDAEGTLFVKAYVGCDSMLDTKYLKVAFEWNSFSTPE